MSLDMFEEDPAADFLAREQKDFANITGETFDTNNSNDFFSNPPAMNIGRDSPFADGSQSPMFNVPGNVSPMTSSSAPNYQNLSQFNEPEKIRKWREEFSARISKKDTDEETKRLEMRDQAKKELEDFYKQRQEQMERTKNQNRSNNRSFEDDLLNDGENRSSSNGKSNDWDKITSLCDFNPKTSRPQKDLTRYRSVLLQLKQQQNNGK